MASCHHLDLYTNEIFDTGLIALTNAIATGGMPSLHIASLHMVSCGLCVLVGSRRPYHLCMDHAASE